MFICPTGLGRRHRLRRTKAVPHYMKDILSLFGGVFGNSFLKFSGSMESGDGMKGLNYDEIGVGTFVLFPLSGTQYRRASQ